MARRLATPALRSIVPADEVCLELADNSVVRKSAVKFFRIDARNPAPEAAKLTDQFISANHRLTALLDVKIECNYDGNEVLIAIHSGNAVEQSH